MAAFMSVTLTLLFAMLYVLFPLVLVLLSGVFNSSDTAGIGAVAGGGSSSFLKMLFPLALVAFLIIFGLLLRKQVKS
jgi:hypothetical protein